MDTVNGIPLRTPVEPLGGVQLKVAEKLTRRLLPDHAPSYHVPPAPPREQQRVCAFLGNEGFKALSDSVDPASRGTVATGPYGVPDRRANRKRAQIRAMICAAAALAPAVKRRGRTTPRAFVDFCGGCGHVGLVLAALYPSWTVTIVDLKDAALAVVRARAKEAQLSNVRTWKGLVKDFEQPFDIGLALHACGSASDDVLTTCVERGAMAVVAPCCVGAVVSLRARVSQVSEPDFGHARSAALRNSLTHGEFGILARAADYGEARSGSDAWRCGAKAIVEADRLEWLKERNYDALLLKMRPLDCTPKNDIIVAYPNGQVTTRFEQDTVADKELSSIVNSGATDAFSPHQVQDIERRIRGSVLADGSPGFYEFACSRGARERRLVHTVANRLGLQHQSIGRASSRRVRVWRSVHWPVYFDHYVGVAGAAVQKAGERIAQHAPKDAVTCTQNARGVALHVTVIRPSETKSLVKNGIVQSFDELLDVVFDALKGSTFQVRGLGTNSIEDKTVFYAVIEWPEARQCRARLRLPPADLHITVGFRNADVHEVPKGANTIVHQDVFVCSPWGK